MILFVLALIGTLIVMAILTIGRLGFGRREAFDGRKFSRWFAGFFVLNYILCLLILYFSEPALTGPFWGWQWLLGPLVISSIANLFAFVRPALNVLEDASAVSQGRSRSSQNSPTKLPASASRGAIAAGIFGLVVAAVIGIVVSGLIVLFTTWFDSNAKPLSPIPQLHVESFPNFPPPPQLHILLSTLTIALYTPHQNLPTH